MTQENCPDQVKASSGEEKGTSQNAKENSAPSTNSSPAVWQLPGTDHCAAKRQMTHPAPSNTSGVGGSSSSSSRIHTGVSAENTPTDPQFNGDSCAWKRSHIS